MGGLNVYEEGLLAPLGTRRASLTEPAAGEAVCGEDDWDCWRGWAVGDWVSEGVAVWSAAWLACWKA